VSNSSQTSWGFQVSHPESYPRSHGDSDVAENGTGGSPPPPPPDDGGDSHSDDHSNKSSGGRYMRWFLWSAAFALTATVSATLGATVALITPLSPLIVPQNFVPGAKENAWRKAFRYDLARPVNILVMGIDRVSIMTKTPPTFSVVAAILCCCYASTQQKSP